MEETWLAPLEKKVTLRMKRRKGFANKLQTKTSDGQPLSPLTNLLSGRPRPKSKNVSTKRTNPFQCGLKENKRQKSDESDTSKNDFSLFKVIRDKNSAFSIKNGDSIDSTKTAFDLELQDSAMSTNSSDGKSTIPTDKESYNTNCSCADVPTDWALKTKLKFKSDTSFSWCTNLKTSQSSKAIVDFVRCTTTQENISDNIENEEQLKIAFRKNLSNWVHPNIPLIPSFPVSEAVLQQKNSSNICKDDGIRTALMKSWIHSFQSVFTLTRSGFCPYFYFCCQSFTALFVSCGIMEPEMTAIITPTTKGFRELIQKDGEYSGSKQNNQLSCFRGK